MKLYLSGPMSNIEDHNHPAFNVAAAQLRALGHVVSNPAELTQGLTYHQYLRIGVRIVTQVDAVVTLPGAHMSPGAMCECRVAISIGIPVVSLADALRGEWTMAGVRP